MNGKPVNDPLPVTQIDPTTGDIVATAGTGTSSLLDKFTVTKPDVRGAVVARVGNLSRSGNVITFNVTLSNNGTLSLNGTQLVLRLPEGASFAGSTGDNTTVHGDKVVFTIGRLAAGQTSTQSVSLNVRQGGHEDLSTRIYVRSSTAQPVEAGELDLAGHGHQGDQGRED